MIQNFQKFKHRKFLSKLSKEAIERRKAANFSVMSTELVNQAAIQPAMRYVIPGLVQQSPKFVRATQQHTIVCAGENNFSPADCLMLSMVLRCPACAVRTLVLQEVEETHNPCYEFDLLRALRKCTSLRAVYILGGEWDESFLQALVALVHVENPRITTLVVEQVRRAGAFIDPLALNVGRMLMDYFNYSVPGLAELTLHGCCLGDSNLDLIASGIAVNTSIRALTLSLNLIEDAGFARIFSAFAGNRRSKIERLDFSYNLLQGGRAVKRLFLEYEPHDLKVVLTVYLVYNRIYEFYHPVNDLVQCGRSAPALTLIYTAEDLIALHHPNHQRSSREAPNHGTGGGGGGGGGAGSVIPAALGTSKLRLLKKFHSASTTSIFSLDSNISGTTGKSLPSVSSTSRSIHSAGSSSIVNNNRKVLSK